MSTYNIGSWATVNDGGDTSGNSELSVSCGNEYYGRSQRSGYARLTTGTSANIATLNVVQEGADEFVIINSVASNPTASTTTLTITGATNSSKLTFSKGGDAASAVTLPANYTVSYGTGGSAQTATIANGSAITGDPGATQLVSFSITLTLAANNTPSARSFTLTATTNSGAATTLTVTQGAGTDYVCFDSASGPTTKTITFNAKGAVSEGTATSVDVNVYSNDDWSITTGTN